MCRCLAKYILYSVNFIFTLIGLILIGLGVTVVVKSQDLQQEIGIGINITFVPYSIISLGAVVFIIAFCGCCGASRESKCMLITYAVFMGILAAAKVAITILLFTRISDFKLDVQRAINQTFVADDQAQNLTFHFLEATFRCCGTTGPDSYITDYNLTAPTCCEKFNKDPTTTDAANRICTKEEAYPEGCTRSIGNYFYDSVQKLGYTMIGLIVYELLAMSFAIYIVSTIPPKVVNVVYYNEGPNYNNGYGYN